MLEKDGFSSKFPKHHCGENYSKYERLVRKIPGGFINQCFLEFCSKCNIFNLEGVEYNTREEVDEYLRLNKIYIEKIISRNDLI